MSRSVTGGAAVVRRSCQTLGRSLRIHAFLHGRRGPPAQWSASRSWFRRQGSSSRSFAHALARPRSLQRRCKLQAKCRVRAACASFVSSLNRIAESFLSSHRRPNSMQAHSLVFFTAQAPNLAFQSTTEDQSRQAASFGAVGTGFVPFTDQRPNPSVERTSNGGAHCHAPSKSVAPLAAAHLKR